MKRTAALAGILVLAGLCVMGREFYRPYRGASRGQLVVIEPGVRAPDIARRLVARGVLRHRWPFLLLYWMGRPPHTLKAGEYLFDRPLAPGEVYRKMVRGEIYLHTVVIPEGSDRFDIARTLQEELGIKPENFLRVTERTDAVRDLDSQAPSLEGYLFPDTYLFPRGIAPEVVVATMLARLRQVVHAQLRRRLNPPPRSLHEVMTLASLVEKETRDPGERPLIAGVYEKRLGNGWPLQCDPTVIYAARLSHRPIGDAITQSDLRFDSPYNTYRIHGLPPGPICNPGEASIQAALHPPSNNLLYFVSNHHGGHFFARTLAEHRRNVARYRREVAAVRRGRPEGKSHAE